MDTFAVTLMVKLPGTPSAALMERLEPFIRGALAELGGTLEELSTELVDSDEADEGSDEPSEDLEATEAERARMEAVQARNAFILELRGQLVHGGDPVGTFRPPGDAEIVRAIQQYDREHPLPGSPAVADPGFTW